MLPFVLIAAALAWTVHGQELSKISMLKPKSSDSWMQGSTVWVMWEVQAMGSKGPEKIDLDLYQSASDNDDGTMIENISFGVPITEKGAEWTVPEYLTPGKDYYIRMSSEGNKDFKVKGPKFAVAFNSTKSQGSSASMSSAPNAVILAVMLIAMSMLASMFNF